MLKKILLSIAGMCLAVGAAFADVEVNKADQAGLDGIKGLGPVKSKAILAERQKGGDFKDWADFEKRVKGIGAKNAAHLSDAGLTVNGQKRAAAVASASASASATMPSTTASASVKAVEKKK